MMLALKIVGIAVLMFPVLSTVGETVEDWFDNRGWGLAVEAAIVVVGAAMFVAWMFWP